MRHIPVFTAIQHLGVNLSPDVYDTDVAAAGAAAVVLVQVRTEGGVSEIRLPLCEECLEEEM